MRCLDLPVQRHIQLPSENRLSALIASAMARHKRQLIERAGLGELADPAKVLAELDNALHAHYVSTNERIADGANHSFRYL